MKIPPRLPNSPLQDAILDQLQGGRQTKQALSEALACPANRLTRSLRSLMAEGKIKQETLNDQMHYCLPAFSKKQVQ